MGNTKTTGCTGANRAANKTAHAFDFTPIATRLHGLTFIVRHILTTLPMELAVMVALLLVVALASAGVTQ